MLGPGVPGGLGGVRGARRLLPCRLFWRWWGWGGVGLEERVRGPLIWIP